MLSHGPDKEQREDSWLGAFLRSVDGAEVSFPQARDAQAGSGTGT